MPPLAKLRPRLERLLWERLAEPLHLNLLAVFVALFGGFRSRVAFDLVVRQHHACGLLKAADWAAELGITEICALEFGVAEGAGLLNLRRVADRVTRATGVGFRVVGFDTGLGLPPPTDYRDHPDYYVHGKHPMVHPEKLRQRLPPGTELLLGPLAETVPAFLSRPTAPIGFISVDVDFHSSAVDALGVFEAPPGRYLPMVVSHFDDIGADWHNPWCGELLAIAEFNAAHPLRKITPFNQLRAKRIFQRPRWIGQMYLTHILDHPLRLKPREERPGFRIPNPFFY